jgi:hypothetical protein
MKLALTIMFFLALTSCSQPHQVVIEGEGLKLTYDCGRFEPKARTPTESRAVHWRARFTVKRARESGDTVLLRSLQTARDLGDTRRLEELVVKDECERGPVADFHPPGSPSP